MRKLTLIIIIVLLPTMMWAQVRRSTTASKPVTSKNVVKKMNNNYAIVLFDEVMQNVYEDATNIYFQGSQYSEQNTLRAIDKQTGAIRFVVPKKKRVRTRIICSGCDGKNIYMQLEGKGIVLFNGTDVNTSEVFLSEGPIDPHTYYLWPANRGEAMSFSPNGRFLAMRGDPCVVFDTQTKKVVRMVWRTDCGLVVADDGCFYAIRENAMWKYPNNGGVHPDLSNKLNDKGIERFSFEKLTGSFYGEYHGMYYDSANNAIYLPVRNQLLKFSLDSQEWSEAYAFSNEDRSFTCINYAHSRVFAHTNDYSKPFYVWGGMDLAGQPQTFDKLNTGIKLGQSPYESPVEVSLVQSMYGDSQGNLWLQVSDMQFVVYNPNGIKGYTAMIGKSTRHEIPQEE